MWEMVFGLVGGLAGLLVEHKYSRREMQLMMQFGAYAKKIVNKKWMRKKK